MFPKNNLQNLHLVSRRFIDSNNSLLHAFRRFRARSFSNNHREVYNYPNAPNVTNSLYSSTKDRGPLVLYKQPRNRLRFIHSSAITWQSQFDTHHFVQRLEREGLNRAQAEGIMTAMADVIDESIRNMTARMVTKAEQEKVRLIDKNWSKDMTV